MTDKFETMSRNNSTKQVIEETEYSENFKQMSDIAQETINGIEDSGDHFKQLRGHKNFRLNKNIQESKQSE